MLKMWTLTPKWNASFAYNWMTAGECLSIIRSSNHDTIKNAYTIECKTVDPRSVLNGYFRPLHFVSDALGKRANELLNA